MEIRGLRSGDEAAYAHYRSDFLQNDAANPYSLSIRERLEADVTLADALTRARANLMPDGEWQVPQVDYYLFTDAGAIGGRLAMRLAINPQLARTGGHIGYSVPPQERGQGYGERLLDYALAFFSGREPFVIVSAYAGNAASRHMIERAGGILQAQAGLSTGDEALCVYHIPLPTAKGGTERD
jgi:predicted acetyltransferase